MVDQVPIDDDPVNHPRHYTMHPSGIECIEVSRHFNFNLGNVIKYIWRSDSEPVGKALEDLRKAAWYLNDEITKREQTAQRSGTTLGQPIKISE